MGVFGRILTIAKPCSNAEDEPGRDRDDCKQRDPPIPTGLEDLCNLFAVIVPQRPPPGRQHASFRADRRVIIGRRSDLGKAPSSARDRQLSRILRRFLPRFRDHVLTAAAATSSSTRSACQCKSRADAAECRPLATRHSSDRHTPPNADYQWWSLSNETQIAGRFSGTFVDAVTGAREPKGSARDRFGDSVCNPCNLTCWIALKKQPAPAGDPAEGLLELHRRACR
jgi:hypothetical protein